MKISDKWMTTFIYEQDLRSYYMNNILYPLLHIGVFNSDISISSRSGILFLNIKKGTTLVFSNDYVDIKSEIAKGDTVLQGNTNTIYGRSFNGKSKDSYGRKGEAQVSLIKCVALEDMVVRLNYLGSSDDLTQSTNDPHVNANGFNKPIYIGAIIKYSAEGGTTSFTDPEFRLLVNNEAYTPEYTEEGTTVDSKYFYKFIAPTNSTTGNLEKLQEANPPDGVQTMSSSSQMVYWLMLGVINPIDREWSNVTNPYAFDGEWYKNHVFTGRGLPEYRYPLTLGKEIQSPEIMFDTPCIKKEGSNFISNTTRIGYKSLYLDVDRIINNGRIYSSKVDWRQFYGVGPFKHISQITNTTGTNPKFVKLDFSSIKEYITSIRPEVLGDYVCIYDVVFACSRNNITNEGNSLTLKKLNLLSYRGFTSDGEVTSHFSNTLYENNSTENKEIYLDISSHNIDDLADILVNRDFLSIAIDELRKDGTLDPSSNGEALIPVCIIFRPFRIRKEGKDIIEPIGLPSGDDYLDCIKPSNVLSFFDIAYKMTELNPITVRTQDAFTVVPVMN